MWQFPHLVVYKYIYCQYTRRCIPLVSNVIVGKIECYYTPYAYRFSDAKIVNQINFAAAHCQPTALSSFSNRIWMFYNLNKIITLSRQQYNLISQVDWERCLLNPNNHLFPFLKAYLRKWKRLIFRNRLLYSYGCLICSLGWVNAGIQVFMGAYVLSLCFIITYGCTYLVFYSFPRCSSTIGTWTFPPAALSYLNNKVFFYPLILIVALEPNSYLLRKLILYYTILCFTVGLTIQYIL